MLCVALRLEQASLNEALSAHPNFMAGAKLAYMARRLWGSSIIQAAAMLQQAAGSALVKALEGQRNSWGGGSLPLSLRHTCEPLAHPWCTSCCASDVSAHPLHCIQALQYPSCSPWTAMYNCTTLGCNFPVHS